MGDELRTKRLKKARYDQRRQRVNFKFLPEYVLNFVVKYRVMIAERVFLLKKKDNISYN